ncbi:MAG: pyridoxamine 5'-phosphate oxidase family protein [Gallicola sp.]|nr:pyridoxamine 5'-phosphate oxidase family protein [Gallicola sp.]
MRRKDREMGKEFAFEVIDKADFGVLSVPAGEETYSIPLSIARKGETLYFHSAMEGTKVDVFRKEPSARIVFVGEVKVPENFTKEELEEMAADEKKAVDLIRKVFTTEYESCIVKGPIRLVEDEREEEEGHRVICEKFTPSKMDYFEIALKAGLHRTNIYAIDIEEVTGKRKKYDQYGEEMKFQRNQ